MIDEPRRSVWPTIFAAVIALSVLYGGSYLLVMKPEINIILYESGFPEVPDDFLAPTYSHPLLEAIFRPAFWVDRHLIRPRFWRHASPHEFVQTPRRDVWRNCRRVVLLPALHAAGIRRLARR